MGHTIRSGNVVLILILRIIIFYNIVLYVLLRVLLLKTPFRFVNGVITLSHVVTKINYNYLLRRYKLTQLTILHANIPFMSSSHIHTSKSNC
jgi:hypothetical protein